MHMYMHTYRHTHTYLFLFLKYRITSYDVMSIRKHSLARVFTLKQSRVKSSDATKSKSKSRKPASDFRADIFFCFFTEEATFYLSIGITSLQSLLKWLTCILLLN